LLAHWIWQRCEPASTSTRDAPKSSLCGLNGFVFCGDSLSGEMRTCWHIRAPHIYEDDRPQNLSTAQVAQLKQATLGFDNSDRQT
jgi:hypothetical protein